mmetsp:Transcript_17953/g.71963  ORF Transcript_17953/g.71963 Transcript_17953/m.71963 type:complete len:217 (+) Transcript_17953:999-1649(+)
MMRGCVIVHLTVFLTIVYTTESGQGVTPPPRLPKPPHEAALSSRGGSRGGRSACLWRTTWARASRRARRAAAPPRGAPPSCRPGSRGPSAGAASRTQRMPHPWPSRAAPRARCRRPWPASTVATRPRRALGRTERRAPRGTRPRRSRAPRASGSSGPPTTWAQDPPHQQSRARAPRSPPTWQRRSGSAARARRPEHRRRQILCVVLVGAYSARRVW